jgi:hypothetical protein
METEIKSETPHDIAADRARLQAETVRLRGVIGSLDHVIGLWLKHGFEPGEADQARNLAHEALDA